VSIEELKKEAEALSFREQGELTAYLVQLRNRHDPEYMEELRRRVEDKNPAHWLTPDQFEAKLDAEG
jgi:hypothetical protein